MQVHVLASGSSGNAILIMMGKHKILVDAGISCRRIEKGLAEMGLEINKLDAVLITHEHKDHVKGLDVLIRKYCLPVYTRPDTWNNIDCYNKLPPSCCNFFDQELELEGLKIEAFSISHDAADPVGYIFYGEDHKCVIATDLGSVTAEVKKALDGADVLVLESNHDSEMLAKGSYPSFLKQRIKGKQGHLSNEQSGKLLCSIYRRKTMQVFLAHLSRENNHPKIAEESICKMLRQAGIKPGRDILLHRTYPDRCSSLYID